MTSIRPSIDHLGQMIPDEMAQVIETFKSKAAELSQDQIDKIQAFVKEHPNTVFVVGCSVVTYQCAPILFTGGVFAGLYGRLKAEEWIKEEKLKELSKKKDEESFGPLSKASAAAGALNAIALTVIPSTSLVTLALPCVGGAVIGVALAEKYLEWKK